MDQAEYLTNKMVCKVSSVSNQFNRSICNQYDNIVKRITAHAESTCDLVSLQNYVDSLATGELRDLKV